jgi:sodium/potassium-transporting ATPase subunit alpha
MVELTGDVKKGSSTLKADIEYFVKILTAFALVQAILVFIVGCTRGIDPLQVFIQGFVTIMCGNVPQGLPTTVTACLFIVAERMGAQNVFVKKLDIIETLGSCSCICTDKTGTLTQNLMSVANLWVAGGKFTNEEFRELNKQQSTNSGITNTTVFAQCKLLIAIASLNSRVTMEMKEGESELTPYIW